MRHAVILSVGLLFASNLAGQITPPPPVILASNTLATGQTLITGAWLTSLNNAFFAIMQSEGKVCTYPGADPQHQEGPATWCSPSTGSGGIFYLTVRDTGDLCVYPGHPGDGNTPLWCVNRTAPGQQSFVIMNGDGNLILASGTPDHPRDQYWQSGVVWAQVALAPPQFGAIKWSDDATLCPPRCARNFPVASSVSLNAAPPAGGTFKDWTGGRCTGPATSDPCVVRVPVFAPTNPPIGAHITSPPLRILNLGQATNSMPTALWFGPEGRYQVLFADFRPSDDPASYFVIDGDTIRSASNRNLCWSYSPRSYVTVLRQCGTTSPDELQTGWIHRTSDSTIRNSNVAGTCLYFNTTSHAIMVPNVCFVDDPNARGVWWMNRWVLALPPPPPQNVTPR